MRSVQVRKAIFEDRLACLLQPMTIQSVRFNRQLVEPGQRAVKIGFGPTIDKLAHQTDLSSDAFLHPGSQTPRLRDAHVLFNC